MTTDNNANLNASRNKINPVDLNSFKVGTNKNDLKTEQNLSIFESLDVNSDGVLNDEEVLGIVTGKTKDKDGNYKEHEFIKVKDLSDGRSLVIDSQGKQQVLSHDGIVLKESYLTKPHSQFKDLKVDSHGNIDENQFTFAALKEKYQSEDYEVWTKTMYGANYIFIDDKKTGKNIKRYEEYNNGFDIWEFDKNEKPKSWMKISKGKITSNTDFGPDDTSKKTAYNNDGTINNVETDKTHYLHK